MDWEPKDDPWLRTLSKRQWSLRTAEIDRIKLNPAIINYVNSKRGYIFSESLAKRSDELKQSIETYGLVIWPSNSERGKHATR